MAGSINLVIFDADGTLLTALRHAGIQDHCDMIVSADDVKKHKPDPEGLLLILEELHIKPENTAMIGDTPADIGAGKNAGVAVTIAVTHGFGTRESLEQAGADHIVDRLSDIIPIIIGNA